MNPTEIPSLSARRAVSREQAGSAPFDAAHAVVIAFRAAYARELAQRSDAGSADAVLWAAAHACRNLLAERWARTQAADRHNTKARRVHYLSMEFLMGRARGPNTGVFVTQLLQRFRHPEHGYRSCLGLLSLAKRYGPARVEAACALARELGAGQYRNVRDILSNGGDLIQRPAVEPEWVAPMHDNLRGAAHYH